MGYAAWSVVFGEQPSASKWNMLGSNDASLADGTGISALSHAVTAVANPYKFRAYRAAAQNTSSGAFAKVSFDTETYDTNSNYDNVTNFRYTAPVAGWYQFNASIQLSSSSSSGVISLYKNGSEISRGDRAKGNADLLGLGVSDIIQLSATNYVEVFVFCSSTLALDVIATTNNYFSGYLVSRT